MVQKVRENSQLREWCVCTLQEMPASDRRQTREARQCQTSICSPESLLRIPAVHPVCSSAVIDLLGRPWVATRERDDLAVDVTLPGKASHVAQECPQAASEQQSTVLL